MILKKLKKVARYYEKKVKIGLLNQKSGEWEKLLY